MRPVSAAVINVMINTASTVTTIIISRVLPMWENGLA